MYINYILPVRHCVGDKWSFTIKGSKLMGVYFCCVPSALCVRIRCMLFTLWFMVIGLLFVAVWKLFGCPYFIVVAGKTTI